MAVDIARLADGGTQSVTAHMNQNGDEVILDFSKPWHDGFIPNRIAGMRVKTKAGNGVGLRTFVSTAPTQSFETLRVAAWVSSTQFFIADPPKTLDSTRRLYCRNETEDEVRACSYNAANKQITITEAFGRTVLPTDRVSLDYNQTTQVALKTIAGSTATKIRGNSAFTTNVHVGWDLEFLLGTNRVTRRVASIGTTRIESGSTTFAPTAYNSATKEFTFTAGQFRQIQSSGPLICTNTGGFSGISVGQIVHHVEYQAPNLKFQTDAGVDITLSGGGTIANMRFKETTAVTEYTLDRALPSTPPADTNVYIISGNNFSATHPVVETTTAATTTVIPITQATWDARLSANHDVVIDNQHRNVSAVSNSARTITLSTALSAVPAPGDAVEAGTLSSDYEELATLTTASGSADVTKELTIDYPISAMKFVAVGGASNTNIYVQIAASSIPEFQVRVH